MSSPGFDAQVNVRPEGTGVPFGVPFLPSTSVLPPNDSGTNARNLFKNRQLYAVGGPPEGNGVQRVDASIAGKRSGRSMLARTRPHGRVHWTADDRLTGAWRAPPNGGFSRSSVRGTASSQVRTRFMLGTIPGGL